MFRKIGSQLLPTEIKLPDFKKLSAGRKVVLFFAVLFLVSFVLQISFRPAAQKILGNAIGADVKISGLNINPLGPKILVRGIIILNPDGFLEPELASSPEIYVDLNLAELFKNKIHVREIRLVLDHVTIERNRAGKVNLFSIGSKTKAPDSKPGKPVKTIPLQIDKVDITIGTARYVDTTKLPPFIKEFPVGIRHQILSDVTDPFVLTEQVAAMIMEKAALYVATVEVNRTVGNFQAQAAQTLTSWSNKFTGLFRRGR